MMKIFLPIPFLVAVGLAQDKPAVHAFSKATDVVEKTEIHRQGGRNIIVQRLAPDPLRPLKPVRIVATPAPKRDSPAEFSREPNATPPAGLLMLSATVFPGSVSRLSWIYQSPDGTPHEVSGWSNIDFNHLSEITNITSTDGSQHYFVMAIANQSSTANEAELRPPAFASKSPTFLPDQKNIPAEATLIIDSLHKLYASDREKLTAAHRSRQRTAAASAAHLLANPPQPKDLIIRYRIAKTPISQSKGGAQ